MALLQLLAVTKKLVSTSLLLATSHRHHNTVALSFYHRRSSQTELDGWSGIVPVAAWPTWPVRHKPSPLSALPSPPPLPVLDSHRGRGCPAPPASTHNKRFRRHKGPLHHLVLLTGNFHRGSFGSLPVPVEQMQRCKCRERPCAGNRISRTSAAGDG